MNPKIYAFLLTLLSGLSTIIGYFFIYIKRNKDLVISSTLGLASGVMICISVIDLIPNSINLIISNYTNISGFILILTSFIIGVVISSLLKDNEETNNKNIKLYKIGFITMISIIIHNIPEGIATYFTSTNNFKLGFLFSISIALHNIPEGISISIPIYYSTKNKIKTFVFTFISGISELLGALITYLFLYKYINNSVLGILYAFIAGLMINISINKLCKESINYSKKNTIVYFILGIFIMIVSHILLIYNL